MQASARNHVDSASPSGSKGSATTLPSAFLRRISTLPSASSSCFWHSAERATPSSNSFIASSRESCGLSSLPTTSSRRERQRSKSGFFGGSGFLDAGVFTRRFSEPWQLAPTEISCHSGREQFTAGRRKETSWKRLRNAAARRSDGLWIGGLGWRLRA
jgi:hypothetical protein